SKSPNLSSFRSSPVRHHLKRGQRSRKRDFVRTHAIGQHNTTVRYDVEVNRVVPHGRSGRNRGLGVAGKQEAAAQASANPEIHIEGDYLETLSLHVPSTLFGRIGEGGEYLGRLLGIVLFQSEIAVH